MKPNLAEMYEILVFLDKYDIKLRGAIRAWLPDKPYKFGDWDGNILYAVAVARELGLEIRYKALLVNCAHHSEVRDGQLTLNGTAL